MVEVDVVADLAAARAQIREMAALLGHPQRGEALIAEIDAAQRRLAAARAAASTTALLVGNGGYTVGPASLAAALMNEAGFTAPPGAPSGYGGFVPLEKLIDAAAGCAGRVERRSKRRTGRARSISRIRRCRRSIRRSPHRAAEPLYAVRRARA